MNTFNDAIEMHMQWKLNLKKQVEDGVLIKDMKEVADCHACELGRWIYGEGIRYNGVPSFESMCYNHEHFHRAAAEVVQYGNSGDRAKALALLKPDGMFAQSSRKLVWSLMECSKELGDSPAKGISNTGRVGDILNSKAEKDVYAIDSTAPLLDALRLMVDHNIGSVAVYKDGEFLGIFTERGYAQHIVRKGTSSLETPVGDMVDEDTIYVTPDDSIEQCMTLMTSTHKRHLAVMAEGKVAGIISIGDAIKRVIAEDREKRSQLEAYVHGEYGAAVRGSKYMASR
jgi:CBS domain-containing protein